MKPLIKCFTTLGALFILAFGVALLAGTIYVAFNDEVFLGNTSIKWTILGIALGVALAVIGGAAEGIYGICKEKSRYVCMFQVFVIIFMVIFIGLGILVIFAPKLVFDGDCSVSNNVVIQQVNNIYNKSAIMFCQHDCACDLDNTTASFNSTYSPSEIDQIAGWNLSVSGFKNTEDCIKSNLSDPEVALFTMIGNFQKVLECSLWCPGRYGNLSNLVYRFSDVNNGKPVYYCYDRLQELFNKYNDVAKYALFGAGGVMLLMFMCNMYLCCCNEEKKGRRARDRFMIMDDEDTGDRYDRVQRYDRRDRDRRDDYYDRRRR